MPNIHPLALVDPTAELADDVTVGPYCLIEGGVKIGARTRLESHSIVKTGTTLGEDNVIGHGAVLGAGPQDRKYAGEETFLKIGDRNVFREYVTLHRATGEGNSTIVGDDNFIMAYSHVGHNGHLGNFITIANSCALAGSVTVEDMVTIGGLVGIHQFCRVGKTAMIGGYTKINRDVPPFMLVDGLDQQVHDINAIGLRRIGVTSQQRQALHKACKLIYKSNLGLTNALETVIREVPSTPEIEYLIEFERCRFNGKNGRGNQP
ncbi:acyl-ACP--UDP-N-acetylglucosamine O-acyltransferase [soil metagenome]